MSFIIQPAASAAPASVVSATASGSIASGAVVILNTDGTVSEQVSNAVQTSNTSTMGANFSAFSIGAFDPVNNTVLMLGRFFNGATTVQCCQAGTYNPLTNTVTWGVTNVYDSTDGYTETWLNCICVAPNVFVFGVFSRFLRFGYLRVVTVSGTTCTVGASASVSPIFVGGGFGFLNASNVSCALHPPTGHILVFGNDSSFNLVALAYSRSGTTLTQITTSTISTDQVGSGRTRAVWAPSISRFIGVYPQTNPTSAFQSRVAFVMWSYNGTTLTGVTAGGPLTTLFQIYYNEFQGIQNVSWDDNHQILMVAGLTETNGTAATGNNPIVFARMNASGVVNVQYTGSVTTYNNERPLWDSVGNQWISNNYAFVVDPQNLSFIAYPTAALTSNWNTYTPFGSQVAFTAASGTSTQYKIAYTNVNNENFLGFSSDAYTNGQTAVINVIGGTNSKQSGLSVGRDYFVTRSGLALNPLNDATGVIEAGIALSATDMLVKGAL